MNTYTDDHVASYSASDVFPIKLLNNSGIIKNGRIRPCHLQICPTNKCNLNCSYCSCSNRNKDNELPWHEIREMLFMFSALGTQGITITGGGEPLLYPQINELIELAGLLEIKVGLVTNGLVIDKLQVNPTAWVRVSFSDDRTLTHKFFDAISKVCEKNSKTDWSFSYVLTRNPQFDNIIRILEFANDHNFCHVRLVSDLLDVESVPEMNEIKSHLQGIPGEHLVIYQGRKNYTKGQERCLISLLKPTIGADGGIYPCCGVQYALDDVGRDFEDQMRMGYWRDFLKISHEQKHFDGSICVKCYYKSYNMILDMMSKKINHREHV